MNNTISRKIYFIHRKYIFRKIILYHVIHFKLSFSRSLACVSLLALLASGASTAEKVTLKLAHNLERSHVVHQAFEAMSKEVNQLSNGKMKIRIYPSSQMGSARETMELLQNCNNFFYLHHKGVCDILNKIII